MTGGALFVLCRVFFIFGIWHFDMALGANMGTSVLVKLYKNIIDTFFINN